ncbi:hypothetical protein [Undibacterium fentianense]|uniref:Uncharacterized protein n=1 Tax=Undibacterium fentianense TaxID=2828728 RepID=A0A941IHX8_9BURK|nr:hypothetical protein [Undibacterium fentianense]MBR7801405.1 hypothetical protein [Undibacterium fentianense]
MINLNEPQIEHPWIPLATLVEIEGWMELNNQELQKALENQHTEGQGICLSLVHGGEIYFHTNSDGDLLLDVTPEASWVQPAIIASTKATPPKGQIWILPQHALLPLLFGLNPLIGSSRLVLKHAFRIQKF